MVVTPAGEFRHVGTQFAVAIVNGATRLRVREGSVQWNATDGESTINAGTEVTIDQDRTVTRRPIATAGRDWAWTESMAPEIEIENRPLQEFLVWFSRETGRKLELADDEVRRQTATIRMHGSVRGLTAMEALSAVMAATTLRFELPEGAIRVSSARASTTASS
jgi:ferric-dicitrate binding protein FerR (iron transport regulator)